MDGTIPISSRSLMTMRSLSSDDASAAHVRFASVKRWKIAAGVVIAMLLVAAGRYVWATRTHEHALEVLLSRAAEAGSITGYISGSRHPPERPTRGPRNEMVFRALDRSAIELMSLDVSESPSAVHDRGIAHLATGSIEAASRELEQAIRLDSSSAPYWSDLSAALLQWSA